MKLELSISTKRVVKILTIVVLFLTIAGVVGESFRLMDYPFDASKWFFKLFDLDGELNIPALYATLTLLFCSGLLAIIAAIKKHQSDRFFSRWKFLSSLFLFLAVDEFLSIHEIFIIPSLRKALNLSPIFYNTWVIPGAIFVIIFLVKYLKFLYHLPKDIQRLFFLAGTLYVAGALGMEMVGGLWQEIYGRRGIASLISTTTEEFLEMIGIVVFIYVLLIYIKRITTSLEIEISINKALDKIQKKLMSNLEIKVVPYLEEVTSIQTIRRSVFQEEQKVKPELEFDGKDKIAQHLLAYLDNQPVGTARIRKIDEKTAKIERLAVLPAARGQKIGMQLMQKALDTAAERNFEKVVIHAQEYIKGLHQKLGFQQIGEPFEEAGIPHVKMIKKLS